MAGLSLFQYLFYCLIITLVIPATVIIMVVELGWIGFLLLFSGLFAFVTVVAWHQARRGR